jgi:hypothetical protein
MRIKYLIAGAAVVCAAGVGTAAPATAAPDDGRCDFRELCYSNKKSTDPNPFAPPNIRGDFDVRAGGEDSYGFGVEGKMRSVNNRSDAWVILFTEQDYGRGPTGNFEKGEWMILKPFTSETLPPEFKKKTNSHLVAWAPFPVTL